MRVLFASIPFLMLMSGCYGSSGRIHLAAMIIIFFVAGILVFTLIGAIGFGLIGRRGDGDGDGPTLAAARPPHMARFVRGSDVIAVSCA